MRTLLEDSFEILPAIDQMSLLSINVGLRPTTTSNFPLIGEGNRKGLFYATGHGRSGILLTPYTALSTQGKNMYILLNGKQKEIAQGSLLKSLITDSFGVAVAVNQQVIPQAAWNSHVVKEGDQIDIITDFSRRLTC